MTRLPDEILRDPFLQRLVVALVGSGWSKKDVAEKLLRVHRRTLWRALSLRPELEEFREAIDEAVKRSPDPEDGALVESMLHEWRSRGSAVWQTDGVGEVLAGSEGLEPDPVEPEAVVVPEPAHGPVEGPEVELTPEPSPTVVPEPPRARVVADADVVGPGEAGPVLEAEPVRARVRPAATEPTDVDAVVPALVAPRLTFSEMPELPPYPTQDDIDAVRRRMAPLTPANFLALCWARSCEGGAAAKYWAAILAKFIGPVASELVDGGRGVGSGSPVVVFELPSNGSEV